MDSKEFVTKIIKRPFIPFWESLESGVEVGSCVIVKGRVPRFADQFVLNFIVGQEISCFAHNCADIALQISARFEDEGLVVNNSRIGTHWGSEEKVMKEFPFARNHWFEVKVVFKESFIKIFIDGIDYALFLYRIPIQFIGIFGIEGDVEIESVVFAKDLINGLNEQRGKRRMISNGEVRDGRGLELMDESKIQQQIDHNLNVYTSRHSVVDNMVLSQKTIFNPPLPFCQPVFNCLKNGMTLTVNGQTMQSPKEFNLRLQWPPSSTPTPDVAISLTVRFDLNQVIRKCRIDGQWLKEEKDILFFPFGSNKSEKYFELKLEINENRFIMSLNDNFLADYVSLVSDYSMANMLQIEGHISLIYVKFDASQVD